MKNPFKDTRCDECKERDRVEVETRAAAWAFRNMWWVRPLVFLGVWFIPVLLIVGGHPILAGLFVLALLGYFIKGIGILKRRGVI